ncbi:hypothetical protein LguiB_023318 [Lonicera macranthoides]
MDKWNHNNQSLRDHHNYLNRRQRENQSFSSTLLDAIYRSIDEGEDDNLVLYGEKTTLRKKQINCSTSVKSNAAFQDKLEEDDDISGLQRRAYMIDQWMEKKVSENVLLRRKSAADFERKSRNDDSLFINSSSSSSDSSCGGVFSSSELESVCAGSSRPKPIRTSVSIQSDKLNKRENNAFDNCAKPGKTHASQQKSKHEGGFVKTKSRALKIYGDLKKAKQPISPGGRLASFLNSIFTAGNAKKKAKLSSARSYDDSSLERKSKSAQTSTCSSASSFSRSCLSKTPSSTGKSSNGAKRSVRFYPVSVIVDEDCQPCGHKSLYEDEPNLKAVSVVRSSMDEELKFHLAEKNRRVEEAARDLLKKYQKSVECELVMRNFHLNNSDEDDDAASCASSDLFELDNLSAVGIERYREELPVYETTHFDTNRAIASGLIV